MSSPRPGLHSRRIGSSTRGARSSTAKISIRPKRGIVSRSRVSSLLTSRRCTSESVLERSSSTTVASGSAPSRRQSVSASVATRSSLLLKYSQPPPRRSAPIASTIAAISQFAEWLPAAAASASRWLARGFCRSRNGTQRLLLSRRFAQVLEALHGRLVLAIDLLDEELHALEHLAALVVGELRHLLERAGAQEFGAQRRTREPRRRGSAPRLRVRLAVLADEARVNVGQVIEV